MIITEDEELIRSILEDETVVDGFSDGEKLKDVYLENAVYFYEPGVGLFPSKIKGNVLSMHAAIPKENRGIKAVDTAKVLCRCLVTIGYYVIARVRYTDKHVKHFVKMVGFEYQYDNDNYHIYRYM